MLDQLTAGLNAISDLGARFSRILSVAYVSRIDAKLGKVKVTFPTGGVPESDWLPVLRMRAKSVSVSCNFEKGEQVLCVFFPFGNMARGFVLGALPTNNNMPYTANVNKFGVKFKDGTVLEYDQETGVGMLSIKGAPSLTVTDSECVVHSDLIVKKALLVEGGSALNGGADIKSTLTLDGIDVYDKGHHHTYDGSKPTSPGIK